MTSGANRWLRAFPPAWRARYGDELAALLEDLQRDDDLRAVDQFDLLRAGLRTRRREVRVRRAALVAASGVVALACALGGLALSDALSTSSAPATGQHIHVGASPPVATRVVVLKPVTLTVTQLCAPLEANQLLHEESAAVGSCTIVYTPGLPKS
jgi:hypothetical protein